MTEKSTPSPASVARGVAARRDFDARQVALHQGIRAVGEHYAHTDETSTTAASRADEVVEVAGKFLAFLTGDDDKGEEASTAAAPDGNPLVTITPADVESHIVSRYP